MVLLFPVFAVAVIYGIIKLCDDTDMSSSQVANRNGKFFMSLFAAPFVLGFLGWVFG
jgi:hypothetical protein